MFSFLGNYQIVFNSSCTILQPFLISSHHLCDWCLVLSIWQNLESSWRQASNCLIEMARPAHYGWHHSPGGSCATWVENGSWAVACSHQSLLPECVLSMTSCFSPPLGSPTSPMMDFTLKPWAQINFLKFCQRIFTKKQEKKLRQSLILLIFPIFILLILVGVKH